jgi:hypothetical protein
VGTREEVRDRRDMTNSTSPGWNMGSSDFLQCASSTFCKIFWNFVNEIISHIWSEKSLSSKNSLVKNGHPYLIRTQAQHLGSIPEP